MLAVAVVAFLSVTARASAPCFSTCRQIVNPQGKAKYPVNQARFQAEFLQHCQCVVDSHATTLACLEINVLQSHGQSSHESVLIPNGYAMRIMRASQAWTADGRSQIFESRS